MHINFVNYKSNSIGFLRLLLAVLVVFSHSYFLGGFGPEPLALFSNKLTDFGSLAVASFFLLSGFLITRSYTLSSSVWRFLWHRALRIFPAFWICLFVTAFIFGPIVYIIEHGNLYGYIYNEVDNPLSYIKENFFLKINQYGIAGLLSDVPKPRAFNGSLWTLSNEFKCYLATAVLGMLGIFKKHNLIAVILFLLWLIYIVHISNEVFFDKVLSENLFQHHLIFLEHFMYFSAGAALFLYQKQVILSSKVFLVASLLIPITLKYRFCHLFLPLVLSYVLIWLAFKLPLRNFDKHGDFSYGIYIYAFPIQQILSLLGLNRYGLASYFILSITLTLPLAILSWQFIEKPCLQLKSLTLSSTIATMQSKLELLRRLNSKS